MYIYTYICIYTYIYTYISIYLYIGRGDVARGALQPARGQTLSVQHARRSLLHHIVSTDAGTTFKVHEYVEQGDGSVTAELMSRIELGTSVKSEWTVGPVDH